MADDKARLTMKLGPVVARRRWVRVAAAITGDMDAAASPASPPQTTPPPQAPQSSSPAETSPRSGATPQTSPQPQAAGAASLGAGGHRPSGAAAGIWRHLSAALTGSEPAAGVADEKTTTEITPTAQTDLDNTSMGLSMSEQRAKHEMEQTEADKIKTMRARLMGMKFISTMSSPVEENEFVVRPDDEFSLEAQRRFLFDDKVLRRGASMKDLFATDEPQEEDFNDIVDLDDDHIQVFVSQELVGCLIDSVYFRTFIIGLIIVNSVLIGLQTNDFMSVEYRALFNIFDQAVLGIFTWEIILKWYHGFWIFWKVGWNTLDFIIVVALHLGPQLSFLSSSRVLRILRVLRAFRSLRSVHAFTGLSMVIQTILQSVPDMANICLLLTIILLMLSVAGVTLFGKIVPDKFGDLQTAMFSLFICVTQDGWVNIQRRFYDIGGFWYYFGSGYFFFAIMIGAFVFANLVVAVVVTNLEFAMKELKAEKKAEVDTLATSGQSEVEEDFWHENLEKVPVISCQEAMKGVHIAEQPPLQLTDLKGLTNDKLQKYFMILIALEENLAEYLKIKYDLIQMYEVVRTLNALENMDDDEFDLEEEFLLSQKNNNPASVDIEQLRKGDILSNLMKLEEMESVSTRDAQNIGDVIKSARHRPGDTGKRKQRKSLFGETD